MREYGRLHLLMHGGKQVLKTQLLHQGGGVGIEKYRMGNKPLWPSATEDSIEAITAGGVMVANEQTISSLYLAEASNDPFSSVSILSICNKRSSKKDGGINLTLNENSSRRVKMIL